MVVLFAKRHLQTTFCKQIEKCKKSEIPKQFQNIRLLELIQQMVDELDMGQNLCVLNGIQLLI